MIRHLKKEELPCVHDIAGEFFVAGKWPGTFCPASFDRLWGKLLDADLGVFLIAERGGRIVGIFGGIVSEDAFNGEIIATEMFWYCTPSARGSIGLKLFAAFEQEAVRRRASRILMIHLSHLCAESLRKLYTRRGYKELETVYGKGLK